MYLPSADQLTGHLPSLVGDQQFLTVAAARRRLVEIEAARALGVERDPLAVRRPDQPVFVRDVRVEPRAASGRDVIEPEVARPGHFVEHCHGDLLVVGREFQVAHVGQLADHAQLLAGPVHPHELRTDHPTGPLRCRHAHAGTARQTPISTPRGLFISRTRRRSGVIRDVARRDVQLQRADHRSSSSSSFGFSPSYLIGENASATSACFRPAASFVMMTTDRLRAVRWRLIAALTCSTRQLLQPLAHVRR